jgi:hypothetical protein
MLTQKEILTFASIFQIDFDAFLASGNYRKLKSTAITFICFQDEYCQMGLIDADKIASILIK